MVLVRHAQASLFEADYDQLSQRGQKQACLLGQHFARQGLTFDEVYIGPRRRHVQTANLVAEHANMTSSSPVEMVELDEHQVDQLATKHIERIAQQFPDVAKLRADFRSTDDREQRQESFARRAPVDYR